jgi:hemerythrin-like metal-binding protein
MKLQTKLSLVLLGGLLTVYGASCIVQHYSNEFSLKKYGVEIASAEEQEQWSNVERLEHAVQAPLIDAMSEGEMEKFEKILASQRSVPGLQEVSLHDADGRVAYSSNKDRLKKNLPDQLKTELLTSTKPIKQGSDASFELYEPILAAKSCLECHTAWKENEVRGVLAMKFSTDALKAAGASWAKFERNLNMANNVTSAATAAVLIFVMAVLIALTIHFQLTRPLKRVANALSNEAEQVSGAVDQISAQSQLLAEGASEQAASLEETSASLEEMSATTKRNVENAQKANALAKQARVAGDNGSIHMQTMTAAMDALKASNDETAKIIKTIDEIAFQTNILALNAAVEAARAGEAGLGFAVVADEVRNLARRSAQAAKETSAKIEGSLTRTAQVVEISAKVAAALKDITSKARQVDELIAEVVSASGEQTQGISQINTAVGQMDAVTQSNAANAEESAAATEELNAQAQTMKVTVAALLNLVGGKTQNVGPGPTEPDSIPLPTHSRRESANRNGHAASSAPVAPNNDDLIQWDESRMATGVETIDEQHQELIKMINGLQRACLAGAGKEELRRMMGFLAEYVQTHFKHEEGLMDQHRCPSKGVNKAAHIKFLKTFDELNTNFEAHGPTTSMLLDLRTLVGDWLTTHICSVDTKLRQCPSDRSGGPSPVLNARGSTTH